ncbi:hypothetical protein JOF48_002728 [Arthrobacter stackebrandtii]|uniref:DUF4395 domain-containing protein n=1 Tax=Arthrobacter stackebrandtii TaxID=272161 RepID=A0ABS4YYW8_9MICC|nr:DUF4395 domain-containing protein [Arthrobacter stackebrandtii]MBP2413929.1 hypothetical protein [Arthrobacter stackebrandtii]PYH00492.1 DUF4395 domain-containing protein [Arthrobacter stackebrandtii]
MSQFADIPAATEFIQAPGTPGAPGGSLTPAADSSLKRFFSFPNPVNEYAARSTAGIVVVLALVAVLAQWEWLVGVIAAGFILRLAFGPRISPAALLSVKVLAPRFGEPRLVPGPPKRFAQGIGALLSLAAFALLLSGAALPGWTLIAFLIVAASLEAFVGLCLGCKIFGFLARRGLIPEGICEECANIGLRKP